MLFDCVNLSGRGICGFNFIFVSVFRTRLLSLANKTSTLIIDGICFAGD